MSNKLVVVVDGSAQIEYDRDKPLAEKHREYLLKMDAKMAMGIELEGQMIFEPEVRQKAKFVSMILAQAFERNDEGAIAAMSAYLADREPELKQVLIEHPEEGGLSVDLEFEEEYEFADAPSSASSEQPIQFFPSKDNKGTSA